MNVSGTTRTGSRVTDIAQLREAIRLAEDGRPYPRNRIIDAARELLTIREAGALIITPDEASESFICRECKGVGRIGFESPFDAPGTIIYNPCGTCDGKGSTPLTAEALAEALDYLYEPSPDHLGRNTVPVRWPLDIIGAAAARWQAALDALRDAMPPEAAK